MWGANASPRTPSWLQFPPVQGSEVRGGQADYSTLSVTIFDWIVTRSFTALDSLQAEYDIRAVSGYE